MTSSVVPQILKQTLVLRGEPVSWDLDIFGDAVVFKWRSVTHIIDHHVLHQARDPEGLLLEVAWALLRKHGDTVAYLQMILAALAYLQMILAALIRMGGRDQPPKRHIRFRSHNLEEQATRTIRFTKSGVECS